MTHPYDQNHRFVKGWTRHVGSKRHAIVHNDAYLQKITTKKSAIHCVQTQSRVDRHESVVYRCALFTVFTAVSGRKRTEFISVRYSTLEREPAENGRTKVAAEKERLLVRIDKDRMNR